MSTPGLESVFNLFSIINYIGILWCISISIETYTCKKTQKVTKQKFEKIRDSYWSFV